MHSLQNVNNNLKDMLGTQSMVSLRKSLTLVVVFVDSTVCMFVSSERALLPF